MFGCTITSLPTNSKSLKAETHKRLQTLFDASFAYFGPLCWWPGDTPFEVCIGAILTQNTAWTNVEKAIDNLKAKRLLSVKAIDRIDPAELAQTIRSAGYFNQKAIKLKNFCRHIISHHRGSINKLLRTPLPKLREELISLNGIGPETADSMILYAAEQPIFVVDAYTRRIISRMGFVPEDVEYHTLQEFFQSHFNPDVEFYGEFHAQIVYLGKEFCRKSKPRCEDCPVAIR